MTKLDTNKTASALRTNLIPFTSSRISEARVRYSYRGWQLPYLSALQKYRWIELVEFYVDQCLTQLEHLCERIAGRNTRIRRCLHLRASSIVDATLRHERDT